MVLAVDSDRLTLTTLLAPGSKAGLSATRRPPHGDPLVDRRAVLDDLDEQLPLGAEGGVDGLYGNARSVCALPGWIRGC